MDLIQTLVIFFAVLNLTFAAFLLINSGHKTVIRLYALISIFAVLWTSSTFATGLESLSFEYRKLAIYGHYIFGYLAYLSFFWFALYYPKRTVKSLIPAVTVTTATLIFIALIPVPGFMFSSLVDSKLLSDIISFNYLGYSSFIVMLSAVFFLGLIILLKKLRNYDETILFKDLDKYQIYFALYANFIAGMLGITFNLLFPLYGNFSLYYVNPVLVTGALTIIGLYNVVRHNLFNARMLLAQFFTAGILILSLTRLVLAPPGTQKIIEVFLLVVMFGFGVLLIQSVLRETKQRKKIEELAENLEDANIRLKELDRQKSEFLSMAAHQLRTPLTSIKGYASLMLEGSYGDLPKKVDSVLETIFASSSRMADTVSDFLNVSRIEQGKMEYRMENVDLGDLSKSVVTELALAAKEKDLQLNYHNDRKGPYPINADVSKLEHVISNLVDNAIKYTQKGAVSVRVERDTARNVGIVKVIDTGAGIPKEALPKLFDKFVRARNVQDINVTGTGLGLYVAREMIQMHNGKIWAESKGEGKGSTFIVEIPLSEKKS